LNELKYRKYFKTCFVISIAIFIDMTLLHYHKHNNYSEILQWFNVFNYEIFIEKWDYIDRDSSAPKTIGIIDIRYTHGTQNIIQRCYRSAFRTPWAASSNDPRFRGWLQYESFSRGRGRRCVDFVARAWISGHLFVETQKAVELKTFIELRGSRSAASLGSVLLHQLKDLLKKSFSE